MNFPSNFLSLQMEEGREAEASTTPSLNTRSRSMRGTPSSRRNANRNHPRNSGGRPTPIVWQQDSSRGSGSGSTSN